MPDPDKIPTKEIPRVDPIVELTKVVKAGFAASDANDTLILGQMQSLGVRVGAIEARVDSLEQRTGNHSGGIRELSGHDLSQEAQLARIIVEQEELKKSTGFWRPFFERIDRAILAVWRDPKVRVLIITTALAIAARYGIHIEVPK